MASSSSSLSNERPRREAARELSARLVAFRAWLQKEAACTVHPAACIVNGEATDGTKNAPVLEVAVASASAAASSSAASAAAGGPLAASNAAAGRLGNAASGGGDVALWDRTMGCQLRAVREIKKGEVMMTCPRTAMVTPDLVACSDAARAVAACCRKQPTAASGGGGGGATDADNNDNDNFWDAFQNTVICEQQFLPKVARTGGPQMLVKILQERKKVSTAYHNMDSAAKSSGGEAQQRQRYALADFGVISTRAPFLAFLIHQRFSSSERPLVKSEAAKKELQAAVRGLEGNALSSVRDAELPPGTPETFAPYVRTLPSTVSLPVCWKRNELALLAGCIPGIAVLQEVAATTMQLAREFTALLEAGILQRFPETFPDGLLTWDRWVWASAVFSSRILPATCYLDAGCTSAAEFHPANRDEFRSPPAVWDEVGVMVPLLDVVNHESDAHQITWQPCVPEKGKRSENGENGEAEQQQEQEEKPHPPRAVVHKKVRKGSEIFSTYGNLSNNHLIQQYGFAEIGNPCDIVKVGWSLADAVGGTDPPFDFTSPFTDSGDYVYESNDEKKINAWWTEDRIKLLQGEAFAPAGESFMANLKAGKKSTMVSYGDGAYFPLLLAAAVVATIPAKDIPEQLKVHSEKGKLVISKRQQEILRRYLQFWFTRKLEKLLQNLDNGLKDHFPSVKLWTKWSEGGLGYNREDDGYTGWQSFFDTHAYRATMEVEKKYYAMGSDSCILTLYDGQLRALQISAEGVSTEEKFESGVLKQLVDLGYELATGDEEKTVEDEKPESPNGKRGAEENGSKSPRSRKRIRKKKASPDKPSAEKPPAVKLHIGNLSYSTTPNELFDYFAAKFGEDNVLECHIPTDRESGRSRGFGFVAMPDDVANGIILSSEKHEFQGRTLKIAKSNSIGTTQSSSKASDGPPPGQSDRCATCGYRPKYCVCERPNLPRSDQSAGSRGYAYEPVDYGRDSSRDYGYYGDRYGDRYREGRSRDYYDDDRYRDYERERRYRYDDSYSRSHERDEDWRRRERSSHRDRDRSRGHSREQSRSSSRRWEHEDSWRRDRNGEEWERDGKRSSRSRSKDKSSRRKRSKRRDRSRSRSASPGYGVK